MVLAQRLISILVVLFATSIAGAGVLFESYSRLTSGSVHTGFIIQRVEVDKQNGHFILTTYTRSTPAGAEMSESLRAEATKALEPVSYNYLSAIGKDTKTIDATFKNGKMYAKITKSGIVQKIEKPIEKGTFLSSFLVYLMLKSKDGIKKGTRFSYKAIAEENPEIATGDSFVDGQETYKGQTVFKILNTFLGTKFTSMVTANGEVLMTNSPVQGLTTEVMAQPAEAIGNIVFKEDNVKALFGDMPKGRDNAIAKASANEDKMKVLTQPSPATKDPKSGVPPGKGIEVKGGRGP